MGNEILFIKLKDKLLILMIFFMMVLDDELLKFLFMYVMVVGYDFICDDVIMFVE